jgi:hypothetical protein
MRRGTRWLRAGAAVWLVAGAWFAAAALAPSAATAVDGITTGSWWSAQPAGSPLPPPPQAPKGGVWVASSPSGATAVSAIRFQLSDVESTPILTLTVERDTPPGIAGVIACVTKSPGEWKAVTAGAWSARPEADCASGQVSGVLSGDGKLMSFELYRIVSSNDVDVVFLPTPAPPAVEVPNPLPAGLPVGPETPYQAFDVGFQPTVAQDIAVTVAPSPSETPAVTPSDLNAPAAASLPDTGLPLSGAVTAPSPSPVTESHAAAPAIASPPATRGVSITPRRASDDRTVRIVCAAVFVALGAWWYVAANAGGDAVVARRRPRLTLYDDPHLVLAASGGAGGLAGRGAFSPRPRVGAPPPLL